MPEQYDLPTPEPAAPVAPTTPFWKIGFKSFDTVNWVIEVHFMGANGVRKKVFWSNAAGEPAQQIINSLNTSNLSLPAKSLDRRLTERAVTDGKLTAGGTYSGTPDV